MEVTICPALPEPIPIKNVVPVSVVRLGWIEAGAVQAEFLRPLCVAVLETEPWEQWNILELIV